MPTNETDTGIIQLVQVYRIRYYGGSTITTCKAWEQDVCQPAL